MPTERTILVTGGGGFIGGRITEVLHSLGVGRVRAAVRRWASAARIGRFPVDVVRADILDPAQLRAALADVAAVVHCAVGDRRVTVEGTRNVLEEASRAGVERVVHVSSVEVYGDVEGVVDETSPLRYTGRAYGDSKIDAEKECWAAAGRGLPVTILRPTLVHGPFSASWTIEWAQRLKARPWLLSEQDCQGTCNLLYVDDLVGAVLRALDAPAAVGEAFNVNGPDRPTWHEYFVALNEELALPPLVPASRSRSHLRTHLMQPLRAAAKLALARCAKPIMTVYQRYEIARAVMIRAESMIRTTPTPADFRLLGRRVAFSSSKIEERLGWSPRFPMRNGIALSAAWLRHHGYVG